MKSASEEKIFYTAIFLIDIILLSVALTSEGTGGNGDSVLHFMYSKHAWKHPGLFFNHWAKPLFTIFSSPFAQFGFTGIKIFNILTSTLACVFAFKTLRKIHTPNAQWIFIFLFGAPLYPVSALSGLTEPLSAAMLMMSVFLMVSKRTVLALSVISFLPFVRSEGLILMLVFFVYLIVTKKYRYIVWLASGHVIMSLVGSIYYHDLLWVFNKIPYARLSSGYGKGTWLHFFEELYFTTGPVIYSFLFIGGLWQLLRLFKKRNSDVFFNERLWLIYGCFVAFFVAHTAFWALGIFNSMGLNRVFVSVFPFMAIIALDGFNAFTQLLINYSKRIGTVIKVSILILASVFPFFDNPASLNLKKDFSLEASQQLIKYDIMPYLNRQYPGQRIISDDISFAYFAGKDAFDQNEYKELHHIMPIERIDPDEILVWDSWFARVESGINYTDIVSNANFKQDTVFSFITSSRDTCKYVIFQSNKSFQQQAK